MILSLPKNHNTVPHKMCCEKCGTEYKAFGNKKCPICGYVRGKSDKACKSYHKRKNKIKETPIEKTLCVALEASIDVRFGFSRDY